MSILSVRFLAFLAVLLVVYYLLPARWRWCVLLCANVIFYLSAGVKNAGFLVVTAITAWGGACLVERINDKYREVRKLCTTKEEKQENRAACARRKKKIMALILIFNFGLWIVMKYFLRVPPLGISFYTFIAMGYCIDVYRGKYPAEKNVLRFFVFLAFFPQMIQGPFSRYDKMKDELFAERSFCARQLWEGALRMLWGFFKKMVVAEKLGYVTSAIYAGGDTSGGIYVLILLIIPTLQLYADFSGYMDIVCGMSRMFGIRLQENFRQPFFARSIEEKWRRWHITLGDWFKDYIFYAISMSKWAQDLGRKCRKKMKPATARMVPSYISFLVVWTATGLWHGSALHFLLWGWMNLAVIAGSMQLAPVYAKVKEKLRIRETDRGFILFQMVRTVLLVGLMSIFSDAPSAAAAFSICASLFTKPNWGLLRYPARLLPGMENWEICVVALGLVLMLAVDIVKEKGHEIYDVVRKVPLPVRYLGYGILFYFIILMGNTGADLTGGFMYAQF